MKYKGEYSDALEVRNMLHGIQNMLNGHGMPYWYIFPKSWKVKDFLKLKYLFRVNGVRLHLHHSRYFQEWVLGTEDCGQRFLQKVEDIYNNRSKIMTGAEHSEKVR